MLQIHKIVCCVIACLCVAAAIPIGAIFGWVACVCIVAGAIIFGALTIWLKDKNTAANEDARKPDFMNSAEENEKIRQEQAEREEEQ